MSNDIFAPNSISGCYVCYELQRTNVDLDILQKCLNNVKKECHETTRYSNPNTNLYHIPKPIISIYPSYSLQIPPYCRKCTDTLPHFIYKQMSYVYNNNDNNNN